LGKARPSELIAQAGFEQPRGIVLLAAAAVVDPDVANGRNQFESFVEWERQPDFAANAEKFVESPPLPRNVVPPDVTFYSQLLGSG
jgi:hypothetical protein